MKKSIKNLLSLIMILVINESVSAKANPDPCYFPNVTCNDNARNGIVKYFGMNILFMLQQEDQCFFG
tara:strand:- start:814 stop:1014 length:201 start_codon:yes stop_codon:yes gene_type:complete